MYAPAANALAVNTARERGYLLIVNMMRKGSNKDAVYMMPTFFKVIGSKERSNPANKNEALLRYIASDKTAVAAITATQVQGSA